MRVRLCVWDTPRKRQYMCWGRKAGSHPAPAERPLLKVSLYRGTAFTRGWYGASPEKLPSPFPGLGLSLLEAPHGVKARQAVLWAAGFFLVSAGTRTFTQAERIQLPAKGCSTRYRSKHSAPPPASRTDLPGDCRRRGHCASCSTPVTVLPAIPTGSTYFSTTRPTSSAHFRW